MTDKKKNILDWAKVLLPVVVTILTGVGVCINLSNRVIVVVEQFRQIPMHAIAIDTLFARQGIADVNIMTLSKQDSAAHVIINEKIDHLRLQIDTLDTKHLLAKQP